MKKCAKCNLLLDFCNFGKDKSKKDGLLYYCKTCVNSKNREWYLQNKDKFIECDKRWRKNNKDRVKNRSNEYCKRKRASDPCFLISKRIRVRVRKMVKNKEASSWDLTGCDRETLLKHLESKFQPGMNWANISKWHIDHIMPLDSFDLTDPEQLRKACHYTNLQPMWPEDNIKKSNKVT